MKMILTAGVLSAALLFAAVHTVNAETMALSAAGIEHPGHRFALGVQWHPEYAVDAADPLILAAFVAACR